MKAFENYKMPNLFNFDDFQKCLESNLKNSHTPNSYVKPEYSSDYKINCIEAMYKNRCRYRTWWSRKLLYYRISNEFKVDVWFSGLYKCEKFIKHVNFCMNRV